MNPTRRGLLGGIAALVAGGKSAAKEIESAVVGAGIPSGVGIGFQGASIPNVAPRSWLDWAASATGKSIEYRRRMRGAGINFAFDPWIASMRSLPLATKIRMQREIMEAENEAESLWQRMGLP